MFREEVEATSIIDDLIYSDQNSLKKIVIYILNSELVITMLSLFASLILGTDKYLNIYSRVNIVNIIFILLLFIRVKYKRQRVKHLTCLVLLSLLVLLGVSLATLPDFSNSIGNIMPSIILCLFVAMPGFVLSSEISSIGDIKKNTKCYIIVSTLFSCAVIALSNKIDVGYNIISSALVVPTIALSVLCFVEKDKAARILLILHLSVIFLKGSRSPLIAIAGALLIVFLYSARKLTIKKTIIYFTCFILFVVLIFAWPMLVTLLRETFPESRTIYLLSNISDKEVFDTGRGEIFNKTIQLIKKNPISGYGLFRSTYLLSQELGFKGLQKGVYSHNMALDLFLQFGLIFGVALLCIYIIGVIKFSARGIKNKNLVFISALLFGHSLQLMVSGTYLDDKIFWICLGFMVSQSNEIFVANLSRKKRNNNNIEV